MRRERRSAAGSARGVAVGAAAVAGVPARSSAAAIAPGATVTAERSGAAGPIATVRSSIASGSWPSSAASAARPRSPAER